MYNNRFDNVDIKTEELDRKRRTIKILVVLLLIAALITAFVFWPRAVRGVIVADGLSSEDIGYVFKEGDIISTGVDDENVTLSLDSDKTLNLSASSRIVLETLEGTDSKGNTIISLEDGTVTSTLLRTLDIGESYQVHTFNAYVSTYGAEFTVSTYKGSDGLKYTRIYVTDGNVDITPVDLQGNPIGEKINTRSGKESIVYSNPADESVGFVRFNSIGTVLSPDRGEFTRDIAVDEVEPVFNSEITTGNNIEHYIESNQSSIGDVIASAINDDVQNTVEIEEDTTEIIGESEINQTVVRPYTPPQNVYNPVSNVNQNQSNNPQNTDDVSVQDASNNTVSPIEPEENTNNDPIVDNTDTDVSGENSSDSQNSDIVENDIEDNDTDNADGENSVTENSNEDNSNADNSDKDNPISNENDNPNTLENEEEIKEEDVLTEDNNDNTEDITTDNTDNTDTTDENTQDDIEVIKPAEDEGFLKIDINDSDGVISALERGTSFILDGSSLKNEAFVDISGFNIKKGASLSLGNNISPIYDGKGMYTTLSGNLINNSASPLIIYGPLMSDCTVTIAGKISGNVVINNANVVVQNGGVINGDVEIVSGTLTVESGGRVSSATLGNITKSISVEQRDVALIINGGSVGSINNPENGSIIDAMSEESIGSASNDNINVSATEDTNDSEADNTSNVPMSKDVADIHTRKRREYAYVTDRQPTIVNLPEIPDSGEGPDPGNSDGTKLGQKSAANGPSPDPVVHYTSDVYGIRQSINDGEDIVIIPDPESDDNSFDIGIINVRPGQKVTLTEGVMGYQDGVSTINGTVINATNIPLEVRGYLRVNGLFKGDITILDKAILEVPYGGSINGNVETGAGNFVLSGIVVGEVR